MSNYRVANTETQWFQDNFPGADMNLSADTEVVCLHTTESSGWPSYEGGATAPNYTALPDMRLRTLQWRAHFPDEKSSRALQNAPGGTETNTLNVVQVELIGTCDPARRETWGKLVAGEDYIYWPEAPVWALWSLARFLADQHRRHGLQLVAPVFKPYPASFGAANGVRLTAQQWHQFVGVCGHQHVPENHHGDPGDIDIDKILRFAKEIIDPPALRVVAANLHHTVRPVAPRIKKLRELDPDVAFTNEAYGIHREVRAQFGEDYIIVQGEGGSMGHREVQLLINASTVKLLDSGMFQATKELPDAGGVAHQRWVAWAKVLWKGHRFLLISWHGNAAVQSRKTWLPLLHLARTREYIKEIRLLEAFAKQAQLDGFDVMIGGDGNYRARKGVKLWFYSPERLFARLGLKAVSVGLDKIAYPPSVDLGDTFTTTAPGADHPWVVTDLERPK